VSSNPTPERPASLLRVLGWPLRRVLNPRVRWTVAELDARLGSQDNTRPPVHLRLDRIEARMEAVETRLGELAAVLEDVRVRVASVAQAAEIERLAADEGLAAIMEQLRLMELATAEGRAPARP
jgi:hypothetical protein